MSNFKQQLQEIRKEVVAAERSKPSYVAFDPADDVLDIRRNQKILFVGPDGPFVGVNRLCNHVSQVGKTKDLETIIENDPSIRYDRIFLSKNTILSEASLLRAASLLAPGGLLTLFIDSPDLGNVFETSVTSIWPFAEIWNFNTRSGPAVVTTACGRLTYSS